MKMRQKQYDIALRFTLQLMRDPESILTQVTERCHVSPGVATRTVRLKLHLPKWARKADELYIDVLHPKKKEVEEIELIEGEGLSFISHEDHRQFAAKLIFKRLFYWFETIQITSQSTDEVYLKLADLMGDLVSIPLKDPQDARSIFDKHFTPGGELKGFTSSASQPTSLIRYDSEQFRALRLLCERLIERYLLLVRFTPQDQQEVDIAFRYSQKISGNLMPETHPIIKFTKRIFWYMRPPTTFRLHCPWAKRSKHYRFYMDIPKGHFAPWSKIIRENDWTLLHPQDGLLVATNIHGGRGVSYFLGNARASVEERLHIGIKIRELPGSSTARMSRLSLITLVMMTSFLFLSTFTTTDISSTGGIILSLLAITNALSGNQNESKIWPAPLLSRITPPTVALSSMLFATWLLSHKCNLVNHVEIFSPLFSLEALWNLWTWVGAPVPLLIVLALFWLLESRRRKIIKQFSHTRDKQ